MIYAILTVLLSYKSDIPDIEVCEKISWGAKCIKIHSKEERLMHEMETREEGRISISKEDFEKLMRHKQNTAHQP